MLSIIQTNVGTLVSIKKTSGVTNFDCIFNATAMGFQKGSKSVKKIQIFAKKVERFFIFTKSSKMTIF